MNELLLPVVASGGAGATDPYFQNVVLLLRGEGANGAQNNSFVDNSPLNLTLTRAGEATQGTFTPFSKEPGKWGVYFDGTNDSLAVAYNASYYTQYLFGSGNWTIEFWINPSSFSTAGAICGVGYTAAGTTRSYIVYIEATSGLLRLAQSTTGSDNFDNSTGITLTRNVWQHVALVRNGATITSYLNGVASGTSVTAYTLHSPLKQFTIGEQDDGASDFTGYISNLRLVKSAVYTSNFAVPTSPLTAITNTTLLTCLNNRFVDISVNDLPITPAGDVAITAFSPFKNNSAYEFAALGKSVFFDGNGDYLTIADNANLRMGTGDFTIEFWINFNSLTNFQTIIDKGYSSAGGIVIQTGSGNGTLAVTINSVTILTASSGSAVDTWDHYALVRSGTTVTLYKNGTSVGSGTSSADINNVSNLFIGGSTNGGGYYVNGYLSNFRIVKGTAVYTGTFTSPSIPLTAITNTQLLTCQDELLKDYSTNNWTITATGQVAISSFNPFTNGYPTESNSGGSVSLDGTGDYLNISNDSSLDINASFTIDAWVYTTATTDQVFFGRGGGNTVGGQQWNSTDGAYYLLVYSGGLAYWQWNINNAASPASISGTIRRNCWNHLAVGFNGTTTRFWINGVSAGTSTTAYTIPTNRTLTSVGRQLSNQAFAKGFISDVRLVKGTDVYGVGNANITVPTAPLTAITNTKLLVKGENAGIIDSSRLNSVLVVNNSQVRTNVKKFNNSSIYFDGTTDYINPSSNYDLFAFGTGDFTIEMWFYLNSISGFNVLYDTRPTSTQGAYPLMYFNGTSITYQVNGSGVISASIAGLSTATWYHIAVARSGTSTKLFIDGTQRGSTWTDTTNYLCPSGRPYIGTSSLGDAAYFNGYMDEIRVTKGIARYTANFTPPAGPFPGA